MQNTVRSSELHNFRITTWYNVEAQHRLWRCTSQKVQLSL